MQIEPRTSSTQEVLMYFLGFIWCQVFDVRMRASEK